MSAEFAREDDPTLPSTLAPIRDHREEQLLTKGITLDGFRIDSISLRERQHGFGPRSYQTTEMLIDVHIAERDTGKRSYFVSRYQMPIDVLDRLSDSQRERLVRSKIREAVMHELDECLLVDGVRVFDPHKDEKP